MIRYNAILIEQFKSYPKDYVVTGGWESKEAMLQYITTANWKGAVILIEEVLIVT